MGVGTPTGNAIRPTVNSDRSHHVPRFPLPVVTSPRSAENRNTHRPLSAARGFVPRRLSYASRRPKLFTIPDWQLSDIRYAEADIFKSFEPCASPLVGEATTPPRYGARNSR